MKFTIKGKKVRRKIIITAFVFLTIFNIFTLIGIGVNYTVNNILFTDEWPPKIMKQYGLKIFSMRADLSDDQIENISQKREIFLAKVIPLRNRLQKENAELLSLLFKKDADRKEISRKKEEIQKLQDQIQSEIIQQIINVKNELNEEQTEIFYSMVEKRIQGSHPLQMHLK
ncbi:MAG: periplasmic heavy metal sensor [Spirochaetia bacterium]|nr:periplasmic heavy metal sensor [Spirochaetia bacterium]